MGFWLVGFGGVLGGLTRFQLGKMISERAGTTFPIGTFLINLTGALLLGILVGTGAEGNWYHLLGDGFLGAYTTFSTFMYESVQLVRDNEKRSAIVYIFCSLLLGIVGFAAGFRITEFLMVY